MPFFGGELLDERAHVVMRRLRRQGQDLVDELHGLLGHVHALHQLSEVVVVQPLGSV